MKKILLVGLVAIGVSAAASTAKAGGFTVGITLGRPCPPLLALPVPPILVPPPVVIGGCEPRVVVGDCYRAPVYYDRYHFRHEPRREVIVRHGRF
jgi:hypothetical protein